MKSLSKTIITLFILSIFSLAAGCGTVAGFGQDVQKGGKAITKAAS